MLYWNRLEADTLYVMDLIQLPDGTRGIRFRTADSPAHEDTALQTHPYTGAQLQNYCSEQRWMTPEVVTSDGRMFGLDPHDLWLTEEEYLYWKANGSQSAPDAPWVNHIPPRFAPA